MDAWHSAGRQDSPHNTMARNSLLLLLAVSFFGGSGEIENGKGSLLWKFLLKLCPELECVENFDRADFDQCRLGLLDEPGVLVKAKSLALSRSCTNRSATGRCLTLPRPLRRQIRIAAVAHVKLSRENCMPRCKAWWTYSDALAL